MCDKHDWKSIYESARDSNEDLLTTIAALTSNKRRLQKDWAAAPDPVRNEIQPDMVALDTAIAFAKSELAKHERRIGALCMERLTATLNDMSELGASQELIVDVLTAALTATAQLNRETAVLLLDTTAGRIIESREAVRRAQRNEQCN